MLCSDGGTPEFRWTSGENEVDVGLAAVESPVTGEVAACAGPVGYEGLPASCGSFDTRGDTL